MQDRAFDAVAKKMGRGNRRVLLKGVFGAAGVALTGRLLGNDAEAARRGYSGPTVPKRDDCPAYCEDEELLIIQAEIGGICMPYLRFWCGADQVCIENTCRSPI